MIKPLDAAPVSQRPATPVQFSSVLDAVSTGVSWVEGPITSLLVTDALGMCTPRTTIELLQRGLDSARETAIREFSALIGLTMLVGWLSRLFIRSMGNKLNRFNPMAIPTSTWISADGLDAQQRLYANALKNAKNPTEARQRFIRDYFNRLVCADRTLVRQSEGQLAEIIQKAGLARPSGFNGGTLSPQAIEEMARAYDFKPRNFDSIIDATGTRRLNELTHLYLDTLTDYSPEALAKAYKTKRLTLGLESLKTGDPDFIDAVYKLAVRNGLDSEVHLLGIDSGDKLLLKNKQLNVALGELKYFLEQVVDRANDFAAYSNEFGAQAFARNEHHLPNNWQELVHQRMFAKAGIGRLKRLAGTFKRTRIEEGLVPSILKQKTYFSKLPLLMAIGTMMSVAFLNNWLTKRKYNGKTFFPGEGVPPAEEKTVEKPPQPAPMKPIQVAPPPVKPQPKHHDLTVGNGPRPKPQPPALIPMGPGTYLMNPFSTLTVNIPAQIHTYTGGPVS